MFTQTDTFQGFIQTLPAAMVQKLGNRVEKAIEIVNTNYMIFATEEPGVYKVRSQAFNKRDHMSCFYYVHTAQKSCSCPDSKAGNVCKHRIAVWLYEQNISSGQLRKEIINIDKSNLQNYRVFATLLPENVRVEIIESLGEGKFYVKSVKSDWPIHSRLSTGVMCHTETVDRSDLKDIFISH